MKRRILIPVTVLAVCAAWFFIPVKESANPEGPPKGPRWFEHIREIKGVAPSGLYKSWYNSGLTMKNGPLLLDSLAEIGPYNIGGRTRALLVDISNPDHMLAGGISGGLWSSNNRGRNWTVVNDYEMNLNVSCITQNPFDPQVIYYGTGEGAGNSGGAPGAGVFKSTDGGVTFSQLPASAIPAMEYCWSIKHSLVDPNTIYVSTGNQGLYRSKDAGATFERVFATTRAIHDIEVLDDSTVIIAVNGYGIYRSKTGDLNSFTPYTVGLPAANTYGRIELAVCAMDQDVIYAAYASSAGSSLYNLYKTVDRGDNWATTLKSPQSAGISFTYAWYCFAMNVKYDDPNAVFIGGTNSGYTLDGGNNWTKAQNTHADYHAVTVNGQVKDKVYVGNDGGIYEYTWATLTFGAVNLNTGYNVTQFYAGAFAPEGISVTGGTQDNGTNVSLNSNKNFYKLYGADGSHTHIHQQNEKVAYLSWQNAGLRKSLDYTRTSPATTSITNELDANKDGTIDDGYWFIHPFEMNYLDGEQLYFPAKKRLWRSTSGGSMWVPVTNLLSGGEGYAVGLSHQQNPIAYVGGSNGLFYRVKNAGIADPGGEKSLKALAPFEVRSGFIGAIKVSPMNPGTVFIGLTDYNTNPRIWKITNGNTDTPSWTNISGNLPKSLPVNWIEVDPASNDSVIFAATDFGLYYTEDGGQSWYKDEFIPNVAIHMLRLRHSDRRLFIYTHGRGVFTGRVLPYDKAIPSHDIVSVPELTALNASAYPNPVNNKLFVRGEGRIKVTVYDLKGRLLSSDEIPANESVDVSALPQGVLIVHLEQNGKTSVQKMLKL